MTSIWWYDLINPRSDGVENSFPRAQHGILKRRNEPVFWVDSDCPSQPAYMRGIRGLLYERIQMEIVLVRSYTDKPWRSPETFQLIEDCLKEKWRVRSIHTEDPEVLHHFLTQRREKSGEEIFVFNIAEYLIEEAKENFLPALLEEWNFMHLGSSAEAVRIGLDKARTKQLLEENQIPTPPYFVVNCEDLDLQDLTTTVSYPLIVKPIREGGHIGIGYDSIIHQPANLKQSVMHICDEYNQPALVEEYISEEGMREFSVGIIDGETRLFTPIEIDFDAMDVQFPILGYEAAQDDLERIKYVTDPIIQDEIIDLAEKTFLAVGASDYSRVDIRMNHTGYYVLEINVMPGLGQASFLPLAAKEIHKLEYNHFIQKLVENALRR
jgi:D-alanine-D-alanine ligase